MTKEEFRIKKSRFRESKCADGGTLLNRDFLSVAGLMKWNSAIEIQ